MSGTELHPELRTVGQLFDDEDAVYTVPVYQRNYAWRAEQIEQLISDINDALVDGDDSYFLGNLIVTERVSPTTDYEVIDGQQRLITLYLLLTHLVQAGEHPYDAHRDRLQYESRPRATEALRRITTEATKPAGATTETSANDDTGIHEGFNVIRQFMNQHHVLRNQAARDRFADFLRSNVTLVRATLPPGTDLNRYFEIMNTRGQQLQQVDIVKARLMSHLENEEERACLAWVWDACADMDSYVQMSLTRGDTAQRTAIFGDRWSWLAIDSFEGLLERHRQASTDVGAGASAGTSLSLDEALVRYAQVGESTIEEDEANVRFRSTIEFPAFLLHVLKVVNHDEDEHDEGKLDDKRLVKRFDKAAETAGREGRARWVREFGVALLRCRTLFDAFIVKRQYTATHGDDGDWSLQRLLRRADRRPRPGYVNTFSSFGTDIEEDGDVDEDTRDVLLLQSMLRVTYTSPRTMHWITKVLRFLDGRKPEEVQGSEIADLLRNYARRRVREAFFTDERPEGFDITRIVFTYLDYLLLNDPEHQRLVGRQRSDFRFVFRNSIEHFYPQSPDVQMSGDPVSSDCLNLFGNLALVSVGANSKFSNSLPRAKAENFSATIELQSTKLREMAAITRAEGWGDVQVQSHHDHVVGLLQSDLANGAALGRRCGSRGSPRPGSP